MTRKTLLIALLLVLTSATASADDLYKVAVNSHADALRLEAAGVDPLLRVDGGFLVLIKSGSEAIISSSGLDYERVAEGITRNRIALDIRLDGSNIGKFPVLYEEGGVRLLRVDPADLQAEATEAMGLAPILTENLRITYDEPVKLSLQRTLARPDLDSLISLISQDSLQSYVEVLESFPPRVTGSASDYAARDWCVGKLQEFGYTNVELDSFTYSSNAVQNVVAYKYGTGLLEHQIVVGAHRDAVSGSPGADDNGSGTAGVLEIARVLKDIETEMSFVFILFTGEEQGLHGSWHYANEAAANGDSIVLMVNMDMIGYEGNTNDVTLYHSSDATYAQLYKDLADSLSGVSLIGHLSGTSAYSDHYPFQQNGYDVVFTIEYNFSPVYHTPNDNSSYLDYTYMARIVKGCLATAYQVDGSYIPVPGLSFTYPGGIPETVPPGASTAFDVVVTGSSGGVPVPGSGELHYKINGGLLMTTPMTDLGGGSYEATLPPLQCVDNKIEFYVSAQEQTTGRIYDPSPSNPNMAVVATDVQVAFWDDFELNRGWTVSGGLWSRGTPTGGGGQYGNPDPSGGHNSFNVFGYNLSGDYENDLPERHLTSPAIDCSGMGGVSLSFWRWLGVEQPSYDHAYVRISTNGTTWTTLWQNTEEVTDANWTEMSFDIASIADGQATVYIRFTMGTTDGSWQYCGWNIDDLEVSAFVCDDQPDADGDGIADLVDNCPTTYNPDQNDADEDGSGDVCDDCTDTDGDGYGDPGYPANTCDLDNCPSAYNPGQEDADGDAIGDVCDNCVTVSNPTQEDNDSDTIGDACDNCMSAANPDQEDSDSDTVGDSCDNCIYVANPDQTDTDGDDIGDACEFVCGDADASGIVDIDDVVYLIAYIFASGPAPDPLESADADCSGGVDIDDAVYIIGYIFSGGSAPCDTDGNGDPDC
ncbi:MAG: M28 family peptidase [candidate division Zixibacteria bacterium]|nr:M28 family peptidase [candidate division Zixibacteria bacterium]MBU1469798.1 M28 family peptidase [candidate division Zixibacteria bacterium]